MTENTTTTAATSAVEEEQAPPCFVRHPDAGGQCWEPAAGRMYDLDFCEAHGEEARLGALMEEYEEAAHFFERFRNPEVPALGGLVGGELAAAVARFRSEGPTDDEYQRALLRAYSPRIPEKVRERTLDWIADEEPGYAPVADTLLDTLGTLHKLLRIADDEGETWLVEILEQERQSVAAQAAAAAAAVEAWEDPELRGNAAS